MLRKRHGSAEITAKLQEAEQLAQNGKTQQEIAVALGVSVMTLHRWKRQNGASLTPQDRMLDEPVNLKPSDRDIREERLISDLELENSRLRRLVTDLLLEKLELEENLRERQRTIRQRLK